MTEYDFTNAVDPFADAVNPFNEDEFDFTDAADPFAGAVNPFDEPTEEEGRSWGDVASDAGSAVMGGFSSLAAGLNYANRYNPLKILADKVVDLSGGDSGALDDELTRTIDRSTDYWNEQKSDEMKAAQGAFRKADGFIDSGKAIINNPMLVGDFVAGSAPHMLVPGMAARATAAKFGTVAAGKVGWAVGSVMEGLDAGASNYSKALGMSKDDLKDYSADYIALTGEGVEHDDAVRQIASEAGREAQIISTGISMVAGKLTGAPDIEARFFSGEGVKNIFSTLMRESAEEAAQEGGNQFGQNFGMATGADSRVGLTDDIGKAAASGIAGAIGQSGGMHLAGGLVSEVKRTPEQAGQAAREDTAAKGGDALDQEMAASNASLGAQEELLKPPAWLREKETTPGRDRIIDLSRPMQEGEVIDLMNPDANSDSNGTFIPGPVQDWDLSPEIESASPVMVEDTDLPTQARNLQEQDTQPLMAVDEVIQPQEFTPLQDQSYPQAEEVIVDNLPAEPEITPQEEAKLQLAAEQSERAKRLSVINKDKDSMRVAVTKLGGLNKDSQQDITGGLSTNRNVPGVGFVFAKKGTSIDDMAMRLHEQGYIPAAEMENLGGVPYLTEALGAELSGMGTTYAVESKANDAALEQQEADAREAFEFEEQAILDQAKTERDNIDLEMRQFQEAYPEAGATSKPSRMEAEINEYYQSVEQAPGAGAVAQAGGQAQADYEAAGVEHTQAKDRRSESRGPERRSNEGRRERINAMGQDEIMAELYTDALTGTGNRRAYEEDLKESKSIAYIDLDGLKYINDTMGHEAGDRLLSGFGKAMSDAGVNGFHISGDEFAILADSPKEAAAAVKKLEAEASKAVIRSGDNELTGIAFSHGIASTAKEADTLMAEHKVEREKQGLRSARGEAPPNLSNRKAKEGLTLDIEQDGKVAPDNSKAIAAAETKAQVDREAEHFALDGDSLAVSVEKPTPQADIFDAPKKPSLRERVNKRNGESAIAKPGKPPVMLFSRSKSNLFVTHNISEEGVIAADDLGGLAAPSLAIARVDLDGFNEFGEISLLAEPSILESSKARVFDADIYSPRQARAHHKVDRKALNSFVDALASPEEGVSFRAPDADMIGDQNGFHAFTRSEAVIYDYLHGIGKAPKLKKKKVSLRIIKASKIEGIPHELRTNPEFIKLAEQEYRDKIKKSGDNLDRAERLEKAFFNGSGGSLNPQLLASMADDVNVYKSSTGMDEGQFRRDLHKKLRIKSVQQGFDNHVKQAFDGLVKGKVLYKGTDDFGRQKYVNYTLDSVVKDMTQQLQAGESFFHGAGQVRSAYAKELKTVARVKEARNKIIPNSDMAAIKDQATDVLNDALDKLKPYYKFDAESYSYSQDASLALTEGRAGIVETFEITPESTQIIADLTEYLRSLDTDYFEAKMQRSVQFSEFDTAIVPKGIKPDALKSLKDAGLKIRYYDDRIEGKSRQDVVAKQERLLFSKEESQNQSSPADTVPVVTEKGKAEVDPKGLSTKTAQLITNKFLKKYKGASDVTVRVHDTQENAFGPQSRDSHGKIKAGYDPKTDTLYIVAANMDGIKDLQATLQHEIIAHKGLGFFKKEDVDHLLKIIEEAAPKSKKLAPIWGKVNKDYAGESGAVRAEELFAAVSETKMSALDKYWNKIITAVRDLLRKAGWVTEPSFSDMRAMLYDMGQAFKDGKQARSRTTGDSNERDNTANDGTVYRKEQDDPYAALIADAQADIESVESDGTLDGYWSGEEVTLLHRSHNAFNSFDDAKLNSNTGTTTSLLGHFLSFEDAGADKYGAHQSSHKVKLKKVYALSESDFADLGDLSSAEVSAMRDALMAAGYEGMAVDGLGWAIVFEGKSLSKVADDTGIMFSREQSPLGLHSSAERYIENLGSVFKQKGTTSGDRVLIRLEKSNVTPDEIAILGLPEFLQGRQVTRPETLAFIRSNGLRIDEVVAVDPEANGAVGERLHFEQVHDDNSDLGMDVYAAEIIGNTHIFITGTEEAGWTVIRDDHETGEVYNDGIGSVSEAKIQANEWASDLGLLNETGEEDAKYIDYTENGEFDNYRENKLILPNSEGIYEGGHFNDDNVLAFTRVTDREIDGDNTYFIEEMQSDWHSDARKAGGYDGPTQHDMWQEKDEAKEALAKKSAEVYANLSAKDKQLAGSETAFYYDAVKNDYQKLADGAVGNSDKRELASLVAARDKSVNKARTFKPAPPDAPFKGDKWLALTMKRTLIDAAGRGAEAIAWPSGRMMSERWSDSFDYTAQYDKKMKSIVKKLTGIEPKLKSVDWNNDDSKIWSAPLPKEARDKITDNGFMMFSREAESTRDYTPEQEAAINVGGFGQRTKKPFKEKYEEARYRIKNKLRQKVVDQYDSFKSVIGDNKAWMMAHLSRSSNGALEAAMQYGHVVLDDSGAIDVVEGTKGLEDTLKPLGAELDDWLMWIAGNRAEKLSFEGKENLFDGQNIQALKSLSDGTLKNGDSRLELYESVRTDFEALGNSITQVGVDTGLINKEEAIAWEEEGFYLPFYRMIEDGGRGPGSFGSGLVRQSAYKKLKGADMQLNDLLTNVLMNWSHILGAGLKNQAAAAALDSASNIGLATKTNKHAKGKDAVYVRDNGKEVWYDIAGGQDGALVLESLLSLNQEGLNNPAMKALRAFKRVLTIGVTASPNFKIANLFRDTIQAIAVADMSTNIAKNLYEGFQSTKKGSRTINRMVAGGGAFGDSGYIHGADPEAVRFLVNKGIKRNTILTPKYISTLWDKYQDFGARLENVNRAANFDQAINKDKDLLTANFEARDHLDFSRTGSSTAVRALAGMVPFLNARLQGLDKLSRSAMDKNQRRQFSVVVGMYSLASMALYLSMKDDEDYQDAEEWEKDTYHLFKLPGSNVMYRLPRPFEVGAIASTAERLLEQLVDDEVHGELFAERLWHTISHTFAFNPTPQAVKPMVEIWANKNSFTGRGIESASMKNLSPTERKRAWTSETAILASHGMDKITWGKVVLSPLQIDHLVRGYLGWAGSTAEAGLDIAIRQATDAPVKPSMQISDYPVIGRFAREGDGRSSKYITTFYDRLNKTTQLYADIRQAREYGDLATATKLRREGKGILRHKAALAKVQRKLSQIRKKMTRIHLSRTMSAKEKRDSLNRLQRMQKKYAALAVKRSDKDF